MVAYDPSLPLLMVYLDGVPTTADLRLLKHKPTLFLGSTMLMLLKLCFLRMNCWIVSGLFLFSVIFMIYLCNLLKVSNRKNKFVPCSLGNIYIVPKANIDLG